MSRRAWTRTLAAVLGGCALVVVAAVSSSGTGPVTADGGPVAPRAPVADPAIEDLDAAAVARLDRAVLASDQVPMRGELTVASFGRGGPQVTTVEVARRADGQRRTTRRGAWEVGRDEDGSYLRSPRTGRLLELGGVATRGFDRERFLSRYRVSDAGPATLDTGPARTLEVVERASGELREVLYVDDATDVIVRRETRNTDGSPLRVVAYTSLTVDADVQAQPQESDDGLEVETVALDPVERRALEARGIPAAAELPAGFMLLDAAEVRSTEVPTVHLGYGDGLYTLSVYVQLGQLATRATRDAVLLDLPDGDGAVWRWPGSEPRRVVWSGDGRTFTALSDAPTGVLLTALAGLPNDPPPSTLERLARGFSRVTDRLLPPWD